MTQPTAYIVDSALPGSFPLVADGLAAPLVVSAADHPGVVRVVGDLRDDIHRVTGVTPDVSWTRSPTSRSRADRHDRPQPAHRPAHRRRTARRERHRRPWETSLQQVVDDPLPGVRRALVIAGSDQRGTIFGAYDVSRRIGVSPWHFWDDVPPPQRDALHVLPGRHTQGTPAVRYRGFFINDENPTLGTWGPEFFGPGKAPASPTASTPTSTRKVFETLLRLKGNYLWPAVWGRAFAEDDPANHATATAYGVVMGTSHEAPMMRGIEEWNRHAVAARRRRIAPRHDPTAAPASGASAATPTPSRPTGATASGGWWTRTSRAWSRSACAATATSSLADGDGIDLMEEIVAAQRGILADVTGRDVDDHPAVVGALQGGAALLGPRHARARRRHARLHRRQLGQHRSCPTRRCRRAAAATACTTTSTTSAAAATTSGWTRPTSPASGSSSTRPTRTARPLWVVNVGDLKGEELPLQFFLDYAWDPSRWAADRIGEWVRGFAAENFGDGHAGAIGEVLHRYGVLQARRKPELLNRRITLDPAKDLATDESAVVYDDEGNPWSLWHYGEMDCGHRGWRALAARVDAIEAALPATVADAYFQLVAYQVGPPRTSTRCGRPNSRTSGTPRRAAPRPTSSPPRPRPGSPTTWRSPALQRRGRRRQVARLPDAAAHRVRRRGPLRARRRLAAAAATRPRGPAGRHLPAAAAHRRARRPRSWGWRSTGPTPGGPPRRLRPCCRASARTRANPRSTSRSSTAVRPRSSYRDRVRRSRG